MENFKIKELNLELLRIISILLIIAHHLAVHTPFIFNNIYIKYIVYFFSLGGKIGVNSFILLTGYVLIDKKMKVKNLFMIWVDVFLYSISIWGFFYFYDKNYLYQIKFALFPITYYLYWFVTIYFIMYLILYFFNFQSSSIERKKYLKFIIILIISWSVLSSYPNIKLGYSEVLWFILLYLIGGYIKLYVKKIKNKYLYLVGAIIFYFFIFIKTITNYNVIESNKYIIINYIEMNNFYILIVSIFLILFFRNLNMKYNKYINIVSSTTLGIYLLHDNPSVRNYLWSNYFKLFEITRSKYLILTSIKVIFLVFFICMLIDLIRKIVVEVFLKKGINWVYEKLVFLNNSIDEFL